MYCLTPSSGLHSLDEFKDSSFFNGEDSELQGNETQSYSPPRSTRTSRALRGLPPHVFQEMPSAPTSKVTALANLSSYSPSQFPYISAMPSLVDVRLDAEDVAAYTISQQLPPVSALATTRDHWHITPFEPAYSQSYFVNRNPFTAIELRSISNIGDHAQAVFTSLAAQNLSQLIELSRILESHRSSPSWHSSPFIDTVDFSSSPCQSPEQPAFVSDKSQLDKLLLALPVNLQESVVASIVQSNYSLIPPVSKTDAQRITDFMYKLQCISWMAERVMGIDVYEGAKRFSHRAIIKFAKQYDVVPRWLCLKKVTLEDQEREDGGGFSDVHRGRYNGRLVALKTMRYYQNMGEEKRKSLLQSLRLEALLWFRLKHKYVLPFLGLDWFNIWSKSPALVTPWMSCKNIRHTLDQSYGRTLKGGLFMGIVNKWLLQIAEGLEYLHNEGVVHGDLRGVNILLTDIWEVQLADFGLSVIAEAHSNQYGSTRGGAIRWVAPELITPETYNRVSTRPTYASDIYSFACICVELYTRRNPWHNLSDTQVCVSLLKKQRPRRPDPAILPEGVEYSDVLWTITEQCWKEECQTQPTLRPSASTLVQLLKSSGLKGIPP